MRAPPERPDRIRADKWLWHARFFKTRGLAAKVIRGGHFRVDGARVVKPAHMLRPGVVLTFAQARRIRVIEVTALSLRRGPAAEAQLLYQDLTPQDQPAPAPEPAARDGGGRPSGKDRRAMQKFTGRTLE